MTSREITQPTLNNYMKLFKTTQKNPLKNSSKCINSDPIVIGASVLAMKYNGGVLIMADTAASYGSLARYTDVQRIEKVNAKTIVGFSGELSDWQYLQTQTLAEIEEDDFIHNDGITRSPSEIHSLLTRVLHYYRNKANPLYNSLVTAGVEDNGQMFLGFVDLYGTNFVDSFVATGFGQHMALPLLRKGYRADLTYDECKAILEDAMRVLVYRHCRTINKFQMADIKQDASITISEPYELSTQWSYQRFVKPTFQEPPVQTAPANTTTTTSAQ